jgi:predicted nucleic acid-binding protein
MEKRLIDANVVLRYLLRDDEPLFARSARFLENVKTGEAQAALPGCVLAECVYVLLKVYRVERKVVASGLRDLLAYRGFVQPDREEQMAALEILGRTNLSIVDCLLCARSRAAGWPLFTFDAELERACRAGDREAGTTG